MGKQLNFFRLLPSEPEYMARMGGFVKKDYLYCSPNAIHSQCDSQITNEIIEAIRELAKKLSGDHSSE